MSIEGKKTFKFFLMTTIVGIVCGLAANLICFLMGITLTRERVMFTFLLTYAAIMQISLISRYRDSLITNKQHDNLIEAATNRAKQIMVENQKRG